MLNRAALSALALLSVCAWGKPAAAQSDGDLSGSRAMVFIGASDMARARAFYGRTLGLRIISSGPDYIVADAGGVRVRITHPPTVVPAPYTVLGFEVSDIYTITKSLAGRGVTFLRRPELGKAQDAAGLWTTPDGSKVAWFRDPDGNMLSVSNGGSGHE